MFVCVRVSRSRTEKAKKTYGFVADEEKEKDNKTVT